MSPQIFLVAPMNADPDNFPALLTDVLDAAAVSALLLPRGERDDAAYETLARAVLPAAQTRDCAVLIDAEPALAKKLRADGVQVSGGMKAFRDALDTLKPEMIVGAGNLNSRHDAMTKAEAGADYVFFGAPTGTIRPEARDDAAWWAETFEVPAVFCDPEAAPEAADAAGCEFVGLSDTLWAAPEGPAKALARIAERLRA